MIHQDPEVLRDIQSLQKCILEARLSQAHALPVTYPHLSARCFPGRQKTSLKVVHSVVLCNWLQEYGIYAMGFVNNF